MLSNRVFLLALLLSAAAASSLATTPLVVDDGDSVRGSLASLSRVLSTSDNSQVLHEKEKQPDAPFQHAKRAFQHLRPVNNKGRRRTRNHSGVILVTESDSGTPFGYLANAPSALAVEPLSHAVVPSRSKAMPVILERTSLFNDNFNILARQFEHSDSYSYLGASASWDEYSSSEGLASALDIAYVLSDAGNAPQQQSTRVLEDDQLETATWTLAPNKQLLASYTNSQGHNVKASLFYVIESAFPMKTLGMTGDIELTKRFLEAKVRLVEVVFTFIEDKR